MKLAKGKILVKNLNKKMQFPVSMKASRVLQVDFTLLFYQLRIWLFEHF
jgi:hypothetical protein